MLELKQSRSVADKLNGSNPFVKSLEGLENTKNLVYYSLNDPMCKSDAMDNLFKRWKKSEIDFESKYWKKSKHAAHLIQHQQEYCSTFDNYIKL